MKRPRAGKKVRVKPFSEEDMRRQVMGVRHQAYSTTMFDYWPRYTIARRKERSRG